MSPDDSNHDKHAQNHDKHASEVIDILAWSAKYRWSKNSNAYEKKTRLDSQVGHAGRDCFGGHLFCDADTCGPTSFEPGLGILGCDVRRHYVGWNGYWGLIVVSMLWLLWLRREFLVQDQGRHIQKAYVLHAEQARILGSYPVMVLEGVSRFYEKALSWFRACTRHCLAAAH